MDSITDKKGFIKLQAMHLYRIKKRPAREVAKIINKIVGMVYQIAHRYKNLGLMDLSINRVVAGDLPR